jgi:hypothetical protein
MTDPDAQFDVIGFETDLYDAAISKMREAKTASETLSYMARAISHGFAILEHIAPLRTVDAGRANDLSEVWRNVQDLIAMHDRTLRRRLDELERS